MGCEFDILNRVCLVFFPFYFIIHYFFCFLRDFSVVLRKTQVASFFFLVFARSSFLKRNFLTRFN